MSNYRVRQVLALGDMPDRQLRLLIALATWMGDYTRTVRLGFDQLVTDTGKSHNTIRKARRELEDATKLVSERGDGRGHMTLWTVLCLPEKGTNGIGTLSDDEKGTNVLGTLPGGGKGTNSGSERVPTEGDKGYQPKRADQRKPDRELNRIAKPSSPALPELDIIRSAFPDVTEGEAESIIRDIRDEGVRSVAGVIRHRIGEGSLRLPCDASTAPHSDECRRGDSAECWPGWCKCRCHVKPAGGR